MSGTEENHSAELSSLGDVPRLLSGLALLWKAGERGHQDARSGQRGVVTGSAVIAAGMTRADLEMLLERGCVEFMVAPASEEAGCEPRRKTDVMSPETEITLTPRGEVFVERLLSAFDGFGVGVGGSSARRRIDTRAHATLKPYWDRERRELRFGRFLVKRFRSTAPNQERVLAAFEESGWPQKIDDPLSTEDSRPPNARLKDTVQRLNRTLQQPLILFESDGTGQHVAWRYVGPAPADSKWGLLVG